MAADNIVYVNTSAARTITLPAPTNGRVLTVQDSTGGAFTNNITINPNAAETIDGASSIKITSNYGSIDFKSDGTNWFTSASSFSTVQPSSVSGAPLSGVNLTIGVTNTLTAASQADIQSRIQGSSAATTEIDGFIATPTTSANSFTAGILAGYKFAPRGLGAGSTVTRYIGFYASSVPSTGTNNAVIADNSAFTGNYVINSSSTNPSVLSGLANLGGGVSYTNTRTVTTTATVGANDTVILCNQSGAFALTLPTATDGRMLIIKDISNNASTNNITITRAASDLIDGATTLVMNANYQSVTLVGSSGNWWVI